MESFFRMSFLDIRHNKIQTGIEGKPTLWLLLKTGIVNLLKIWNTDKFNMGEYMKTSSFLCLFHWNI